MSTFPAQSAAVERGLGFFETLWCLDGRVSLFERHVERLRGTLSELGLPAPTEAQLREASRDALAAHGTLTGEHALRWTWAAAGQGVETADDWRLEVGVRPVPPLSLGRRQGCVAVSLPAAFQRDNPHFKSTSYAASSLGLRHAERQGANEGLFVGADDRFLEGTASSLLVWNEGHPVIPAGPQLPGTTRAAFLEWWNPSAVAASDVLSAERLRTGTLVLGALTLAAPLVTLDGQPCAVPKGLREALEGFQQRLRDDVESP